MQTHTQLQRVNTAKNIVRQEVERDVGDEAVLTYTCQLGWIFISRVSRSLWSGAFHIIYCESLLS